MDFHGKSHGKTSNLIRKTTMVFCRIIFCLAAGNSNFFSCSSLGKMIPNLIRAYFLQLGGEKPPTSKTDNDNAVFYSFTEKAFEQDNLNYQNVT